MPQVETPMKATITGAELHTFIESQRKPGERLYGVVDAARDKKLAFDGALRYAWELQWLFTEDTDQQMNSVAPYLVPITFESSYPYPESEYLDLWAARLGRNAGILLLTDSGPENLRDDLSSAFQVADEEDNVFFFRFYDPRVLRPFLKICTLDEAKSLFGRIRRILVEGDSPGSVLLYRVNSDGVAVDSDNLTEVSSAEKGS